MPAGIAVGWFRTGQGRPLTRRGWLVLERSATGRFVRRFTTWLIIGGHFAADPFWAVKAPKVDQPVVEPLTDDEPRALITACAALGGIDGPNFTAPGERLCHRRDEAIVRLMCRRP